MNFDTPIFLLALILLLPFYLWSNHLIRVRRRYFDIDGQNQLIRSRFINKTYQVKNFLLVLCLAFLIISMAGPSWGSVERPYKKQGIDVVFALDISRSMTATDVIPSRLEMSVFELQKLLQHLEGNRVGLVLFAGNAIERAPLTLDIDALSQLIDQAQWEFPLVKSGTDLDDAVSKSLALLSVEDSASTQSIVIISDGEDIKGVNSESIQQANLAGIAIYTVAVGTESGGFIPNDLSGGGVTKVDVEKLKGIAEITGGMFFQVQDIESIIYELHRGEITEFENINYTMPNDISSWFVCVVVCLLVIDLGLNHRLFSSKNLFTWGMAIVIISVILGVGCSDSKWSSSVKAGNQEYLEGNFDLALSHYLNARELDNEDPLLAYHLSNVLHYLGRDDEAAVVAQQALLKTDDVSLKYLIHYAMGTYAFERGMLESARDHYIRSLQLQPTHNYSKQNLELVLSLLMTREITQQELSQPSGSENAVPQNEINTNGDQLTNAQSITTANDIAGKDTGGLNTNTEKQDPVEENQIETEYLISEVQKSFQSELIDDSNVLTRLEANNLVRLIQRWNELQREEELSQELFSIDER
ncbi:MAG: VWA domain-containing protein, partial [Dehalococcoidia bacterium]|nr:VWA domain-containing protein [Dehalococcoidia bacterium]